MNWRKWQKCPWCIVVVLCLKFWRSSHPTNSRDLTHEKFQPLPLFSFIFFFSKSHTAPRLSTHHAHTLAVLCSKYHVLPSEKPPPKPITNDLLKYFNPKKLINQPDQASKLRKAIFLKKSLSLFSLSFSLTSLFAIMRSS